MIVTVTGGAGFIGSNLVRLLRSEGHQVTVLDNLSSGHRRNLDPFPEVQFIEGDIRDARVVDEALRGAEVVFHMAASVGNARAIAHPLDDSAVNVMGTLVVLEAARANGLRKIVYSSSAGIFGELRTLPISEDHPIEPDSPYGVSKLAGEKHCLAYAKLHGIEAVCLRYFNVYGPNQRYDAYGNVIPIFVERMLGDQSLTIFGDGEQTRDFISVHDVVQANYLAATNPGSGAFNLGSGTRVTINELVRMLGDANGSPCSVQHGATRPGDVRHSLADIRAAGAAFGFQPQMPLDRGVAEYLAWARADRGLDAAGPDSIVLE